MNTLYPIRLCHKLGASFGGPGCKVGASRPVWGSDSLQTTLQAVALEWLYAWFLLLHPLGSHGTNIHTECPWESALPDVCLSSCHCPGWWLSMSIALPQCQEHQVPPISGFIMTGCLWRILVNGLSTRVYTNNLYFSLRYYAQLPHHSRIFLLAFSGKFTLRRTLRKCVQGQREGKTSIHSFELHGGGGKSKGKSDTVV